MPVYPGAQRITACSSVSLGQLVDNVVDHRIAGRLFSKVMSQGNRMNII
jgi:hypothetical protein